MRAGRDGQDEPGGGAISSVMSGAPASAHRPPRDDADAFVIRVGNHAFPLRIRGQPIRSLYPGWRIHALHVTLLPMAVAQLRNDAGAEAYWIFDSALDYRASLFDDLDEEEQSGMVDAVAPFFSSLVRSSLEAVKQSPSENAELIRNLGAPLRDALLAAWLRRFPPPRCVTPRALPETTLSFPDDVMPLAPKALAPLLSAAAGLTEQPLPVILSPWGHAVLRGHHVLKDIDLSLTRFADPQANIVLYLGTARLSAENDETAPVLCCPQLDLIVTDLPSDRAGQIPQRLLSRFTADPTHVSAAPAALLMQFGAGGNFTLGSASSLPVRPPLLPGNWPAAPAAASGDPMPDTSGGQQDAARFPDAQVTDAFRTNPARPPPEDSPEEKQEPDPPGIKEHPTITT